MFIGKLGVAIEMILEKKIMYNGILKRQEKAIAWFESEDFKERFDQEGKIFFERAYLKWKRLDDERIKILNELEASGALIDTYNIVYGFDVD